MIYICVQCPLESIWIDWGLFGSIEIPLDPLGSIDMGAIGIYRNPLGSIGFHWDNFLSIWINMDIFGLIQIHFESIGA